MLHTPPNFSGSTPRNFWFVFGVTKSRSLCQAFLVETVETGTKNRCVIEATHALRRNISLPRRRFCGEGWETSSPKNACVGGKGNIKLSAFPKRVGPRILSLESVDYFGASEQYWVVEKKKKRRILISKIAMIQLTWEIQIPLLIYVPPPGKHVSLVICVPPPGKHVSLVICVPPPGKHVSLVTCAPPPGKLYRKHISLVMCQGHPTRI